MTHEIQFARQVSDQVLFIDQGVVPEQGSPDAVIGNPTHNRTRQFLNRICIRSESERIRIRVWR